MSAAPIDTLSRNEVDVNLPTCSVQTNTVSHDVPVVTCNSPMSVSNLEVDIDCELTADPIGKKLKSLELNDSDEGEGDIPQPISEKLTTTSQDIELPDFTSEEREEHLARFEIVLDKKLVKKFQDLFSKKIFDVNEPLYQAWLHLKFAALGSEHEALDKVLASKAPKNIPKQKRKRNDHLPKGAARHNPLSKEFKEALLEQENKKETKSAPPAKKMKKSQQQDVPGPSKTGCKPKPMTGDKSDKKVVTKRGRK